MKNIDLKVVRVHTEYGDDIRVSYINESGNRTHVIRNGLVHMEKMVELTGKSKDVIKRVLNKVSGKTYALTNIGSSMRITFFRDVSNEDIEISLVSVFSELVNI